MTFAFVGLIFEGINVHLHVPPPELLVRRQRYWNLIGSTEIRGKPTDRQITLDFILRNNYATYADLAEALDLLDSTVGEHGILTIVDEANGLNRDFGRATFMGFTPGQDEMSGPKKDEANDPPWGWWIRGVCTWHDVASVGRTASR